MIDFECDVDERYEGTSDLGNSCICFEYSFHWSRILVLFTDFLVA